MSCSVPFQPPHRSDVWLYRVSHHLDVFPQYTKELSSVYQCSGSAVTSERADSDSGQCVKHRQFSNTGLQILLPHLSLPTSPA